MRPNRRGADTRNKILDVAEQDFARSGFAGAHLQYIAEQVGVQKTALYYYFPSKAALYEAVLVRMLEAFDQTVSKAIDGPESPASRLERLSDALNDLLSEQRNYSQILIRIFVDRVEIDGLALRPLIERVVGRLLAFYREGVDADAFVKLSSRNLFQSLLGVCRVPLRDRRVRRPGAGGRRHLHAERRRLAAGRGAAAGIAGRPAAARPRMTIPEQLV